MEFTQIATELTTSLSDIFIAILSCYFAWRLSAYNGPALRKRLWRLMFCSLALAALLGGVVHGIVLPGPVYRFLWQPIYIALSATIVLFLAATSHDLLGEARAKKLLPFLAAIGLFFYGLTLLLADSFVYFSLFQGVSMLACLFCFVYLFARRQIPGAGIIVLAIVVSIAAAYVQTLQYLRFNLIFEFDNNGLYHIVQSAGEILLYVGIRKG